MKKIFTLIFLMIISLGQAQTPPSGPTDPPVRNPWDVFSIFSDSYTNQTGVQYFNFGGSTIQPDFTPPGGTPVKHYTGHSFSGIQVNTAGSLNVSTMTHLHFDVWSPNYSSMRLKLESSTGTAIELNVTGPVVPSTSTRNQWISVDLALSTYNSGNILTSLKYIVPVTFGQNATLFIDNVYFYRPQTANPPPTITGFSVPAQLVGAAPFNLTAPSSNSSGAFTYTSSNTSVATISGNTVTIQGVGSSTITANQAADGTYTSGSATATLVVTPPAAPLPPARNTQDVISFYSNTYTPSSTPTWGGTSNNDISISGNTTRIFNAGFTNGQIAFAPTNVSQMTHVHVDIFSVNLTPMWFFLGSKRLTLNTPVNGWTSLDIPLSDFTSSPAGAAINLSSINLFRIENPVGATAPPRILYVDNIYFYRPQTDAPPTLGTFTVPTKLTTDAPFNLTPPTSNSSGAWTYTSSNSSIATISGNTLTIQGGGTATITANQAPVPGLYGPGQRTASFIVTFPDPGPSPIPPAREPSKVISLYTGNPPVYANAPNFQLVRSFWTAATTSNFNFPNGTNTCIQVNNLGFIGLIDVTERRLNLTGTGMTHMNIDIYLDSPLSNLFVVLLAPSDRFYNTGPLPAGWNNLNIPLTAYPGALNDVYGLKIEQNVAPNTTRIFVDNFYFSNDNITYYADNDSDGFGDTTQTIVTFTGQPLGYVLVDGDCNDNNPAVNPSATEVCFDGIDNNCDGTIDEGCVPIVSTVQTALCGVTLPEINSYIYANLVSGAQGYRFKVTDMSTMQVQTIDKALRVFQLTQLTNYAFNRTYQVEVSVRKFNVWQPFYGAPCNVTTPATTTQVRASQCGSTLSAMGDVIYADNVPFASGYRFRVVNTLTSNTQVVDRTLREFRMNLLTNPEYNTLYTVEVAIKNTDGTYLPYGPICNITTPEFPTTFLQNSQCDYTAVSNNETFYAVSYTGATTYRFRFINTALSYSYTFDKGLRTFNLSEVPGLQPATTYAVQVSIELNGEFGPYGKVCSLTTPGTVAITRTTEKVVPFTAVAYPNPYAESFNLNVTTSSDANIKLTIYDMIGKQIEAIEYSAKSINTIQIGDKYSTGIYNIFVNQGEYTQSIRVIKR